MIFIVYGTRAELIKFSTLIRELKKRKAPFKTVDTGQHDNSSLIRSLRLPEPDFHLGGSYRESWSRLEATYLTYPIASIMALFWGFKVFLKLSRILSEGNVVVTHGNTIGVPVTIYATRLSSRKSKLVHAESGMRGTTNETRLLDFLYEFADKRSDVLFTPFESTKRNLVSEYMKGKIIVTGDVMKDVVRETLKMKGKVRRRKSYVLANITRSIKNRHDAKQILHALSDSPIDVVLVTNPVIRERIRKFGLGKTASSGRITESAPMDYPSFLHMLKESKGAVTDSNGVEEECAVLQKPCIVTNNFLQIKELEKSGVVRRAGSNYIGILKNLRRIHDGTWKVRKKVSSKGSPTKRIADYLVKMERSSR